MQSNTGEESCNAPGNHTGRALASAAVIVRLTYEAGDTICGCAMHASTPEVAQRPLRSASLKLPRSE